MFHPGRHFAVLDATALVVAMWDMVAVGSAVSTFVECDRFTAAILFPFRCLLLARISST